MRLWHFDILPYLPKSQLLAQWRELNSIFKKQDKNILINYIYDYRKIILLAYTCEVVREMSKRNIKIKSFKNCNDYFLYGKKDFLDKNDIYESAYLNKYEITILSNIGKMEFKEHNNEYLLICFMNLYEKYIRGQKDFDKATFDKLYDFVNTKFDLKSLGINKEK